MNNQPAVKSLSEDVILELSELEALGVHVPAGAYKDAMNLSKMAEYAASSATTTDISDVLIAIHSQS